MPYGRQIRDTSAVMALSAAGASDPAGRTPVTASVRDSGCAGEASRSRAISAADE
jgi:hypothetical protein